MTPRETNKATCSTAGQASGATRRRRMMLQFKSDEEFAAEALGLHDLQVGTQGIGIEVSYFWSMTISPSFEIPAFLAVVSERLLKQDGVSRLRGVLHTGGDITTGELRHDTVLNALRSPSDGSEPGVLDGTYCSFRLQSHADSAELQFPTCIPGQKWHALERAARDIALHLATASRNETLQAFITRWWA